MGTTTTTRMTFEEFERLPDEPGKQELLEGELIQMPPAKRPDMISAERLFMLLHGMVDDLRRRRPDLALGSVHMEMGYRIGSDGGCWLVPDVSITHAGQSGAATMELQRDAIRSELLPGVENGFDQIF